MARRKPPRDVTAASSNAEMMRTLAIGGAGGHYGFGRYPEGVLSHGFATSRHMVFGRAKSHTKSSAELAAEIDALQREVSERAARARSERKRARSAVRPGGRRDV